MLQKALRTSDRRPPLEAFRGLRDQSSAQRPQRTLGMAQILCGFRTHGAASVDVHSGNLTHAGVAASLSPTLCLGSATLCKIGTLLVTFGGQCCISATAATV